MMMDGRGGCLEREEKEVFSCLILSFMYCSGYGGGGGGTKMKLRR